ncbi:hypothetical protein X975_17465, partial [Stegodyphus mimosarum]
MSKLWQSLCLQQSFQLDLRLQGLGSLGGGQNFSLLTIATAAIRKSRMQILEFIFSVFFKRIFLRKTLQSFSDS